MVSYQEILRFFSKSERAILAITLTIALIGSAFIVDRALFSPRTVASQARFGETLSIGNIGTTETLNSLYCTASMTVRTACNLVFSGLFSIDPFTHSLKPELAENMETSSDLKTYTVTLRTAFFQDGATVSSDDVIFTYNTLVKDPNYDGPYKGAFNGVKIEATTPKTIVFTLDEANTFFPYNLTIGIMPKHAVEETDSINAFLTDPYNRNPIGSGQYKVESISKDGTSSEIKLTAFEQYYGEKPYIQNIHIYGFTAVSDLQRALNKFDVVYAENLDTTLNNGEFNEAHFVLPQYVGLFFNTTSKAVSNKGIRLGLKVGTDRNKLLTNIDKVQVIDSPFPDILTDKITFDLEKGKALLTGAKVTPNTPIEVKLVYRKDPVLQKVAEEVARQWEELGVRTILISQEFGELQNNYLKTRDYDVLLIGERLGANLDLYPYFHSSQSKYPGLNFSLYKNVVVDNLLNKIRLTRDANEQKKLLKDAYTKILEDMPFIPLYTNDSTILINKRVKNTFIPTNPTSPEQFYALIKAWYIAEKQIWI